MSNESFVRTSCGRPDDLQLINTKFEIDPLLHQLLSLCTVAGTEHHIVNIIRELPYVKKHKRFFEPKLGNYIVEVGKSKTLFSCHMDIVGHNNPITLKRDKVEKIFLFTPEENLKNSDKYGMIWGAKANLNDKGDRIVSYTPSTLGADDKVGVYILLKMIEAQIPGKYIFHTGEEQGGLGSAYLAANHKDIFEGMDRAIAFDRANYNDIIGFQRGGRCCSTEFGKALAEALNVGMPPKAQFKEDVHGTFTDTANYTKIIPECTNVSVGYFSQHGSGEHLDVYWLDTWLLPAILKTKFEDLPVKRDPKEVVKSWSSNYSSGYNNDYNKQYNETKKKGWKDTTKDTGYMEFPIWEPKLNIPDGASKEVLTIAIGRYLSKTNYGKDRDAFCEWLIDRLETVQLLEEEVYSLNATLAKVTGKKLTPNPPDVILLPPPTDYKKEEATTAELLDFEEKVSLLTRLIVLSEKVIVQAEPQKWLNNYTKGAKKIIEKIGDKKKFSEKEVAKVNRVIFAMATILDEAPVLLPEEEKVLDDVQKHICQTYMQSGWWYDFKKTDYLNEDKSRTVH